MAADTFDIVSGLSHENARWIDVAVGIDQARQRMRGIAAEKPADYFVFHVRTGAILDRVNLATPKTDEEDRNPQSGMASLCVPFGTETLHPSGYH